MKDKFSEFYYKPNLDKLWNDCIFVFDTNVLINLYYEKNVYFKFIEILENKIKNRIWMPYQVGLEYHNHRFDAVKNKEKIYFNLIGSYNGIAKSIDTVIIKLSKENHFMDLPKYMDLDEIKEQLDKLNEIIETINQKVDQNPDFLYDDEVRNKLDELYSGKIGDNYPENRLQEIYDMGKIRYSQKIPPGFKDKKYGDLVIWFQMMEYAKHQNLPIIFITDDSKEDWWLRPESTGGPHPALIKEFTTSTNQDFFIYTLSEFLKNAKEYLNVDVDPETIDTAKEIQVISEDVQGIENEITSSSLAKSYLKYLKPTNNLYQLQYPILI